MRGICKPCLAILLSSCLAFSLRQPAYGSEEQAWEGEADSKKEGRYAEEMTVRIPQYEVYGEKIIEKLGNSDELSGTIDTGIVFDSVGEAVSFGRYFYRYIYFGKEKLQLATGQKESGAAIYVWCGDFARAAQQHRQAETMLREIVAASGGMEASEKALFFYEWTYNHVEYDAELEKKTVYEAIIEERSVCWGYVSVYMTLCRKAGLICEPVYRGNHAWNRVWVKGGWKHCDITWDKAAGGRQWRLLPEKEMDTDPMHCGLA